MGKTNAPLYSLNGGEVGKEALARLDLERMQFAAALCKNMSPRVIGSLSLRPGFEHITNLDLGEVRLIEYSYSGTASLIPVLSNLEMRVLKDDAFVTYPSVSTSVTSGGFTSFVGWTDASTGSAGASAGAGLLLLRSTPLDRASAKQTISVSVGDQGVEHAMRVSVTRGPVSVRLGSTAGADDLIVECSLDDGIHSIAFTPTTSSIFLELFNDNGRDVLLNSCQLQVAGTMIIPTPWTSQDLEDDIIRYKQSKDVIYVASTNYQQREIQRRGDTSWGLQRYKVSDGPFSPSAENKISLDPSVYTGPGTLTASRSYFDVGMIGRLFRLVQRGQTVTEVFTADPADGAFVRISGVGNSRRVTYTITGSWAGVIRLQIALDDGTGLAPGAFSDAMTFTSNDVGVYEDADDNVIKYLRFSLTSGDLTSGQIVATLSYPGGSQTGIVRMTSYSSTTVVGMEVINRLYSKAATFEWDYSTWSDYDGWPSAVDVFGGRLYWGQIDLIHGSVPDSFKSFDDTIEGESAPIARSISSSSQRGMLWLLGLQRLLAGTDAAEISIKASSFDEPLTATSWFPVEASTRGCANIRAVKADKDGVFVQASKIGAFRLLPDKQGLDYSADDLMAMHEKICGGSEIIDLAVQRRPDTVVWFILADGTARTLTYEPSQNIIAWARVDTDGLLKHVAAIRGAGQDSVYFVVVRDGTQRLERLAKATDCIGGALNCIADGFKRFTATAAQTSFSVSHLDGLDVTVWANGVALHDQTNLYTVVGGEVTLPAQTLGNQVVIGLPYIGQWQSTKLAYGAQGGTALLMPKRVAQLGLYLIDSMLDGLRVGHLFGKLKRLTRTENDVAIPAGHLYEAFDANLMAVNSDWSTDSRVCIEARSPYPLTVGAMVMDAKTNA